VILLRSIAFNAFFFGVTFLLTFPATVVRLAAPEQMLSFAMNWARLVLWGLRVLCGIRIRVTGREHLPEGAALIASAHQSAFDTLVWLTIVPRACYVLKQELLRIPLFGPLMVAARMIPIDRTSGATALRGLLKGGERAAAEGRQIVIFPEGTRAAPGTVLPLQPGVAALAARLRCPVVPVTTNSGLHWGRRAFRKVPGTIEVVIRPPLPAGLDRVELMRRLAAEIRWESGEDPVDNSVGAAPEHAPVFSRSPD